MKPLNIVFMGNPEFAVPALEKMHGSIHRVLSVVTGTDKRRARGTKHYPSPVKSAALQMGIPVLETDNVRSSELAGHIKAMKPDLIVVVAFKMLPPEILAIPVIGSVNLHASLLPKYRGAAPIHRALIQGEKKTGCTVFFLDEGMDTGHILSQESIQVDLLETTGDVYERLRWLGADLLLKTIDEISSGRYTGEKQGEGEASKAPRITLEEARIDFQKDCITVHNLIRGMSPFPGAWTEYNGKKIKLYRTRPDEDVNLTPGEVQFTGGACYAGCGKGSVAIIEIQPGGRKKMSGTDFFNGTDGNVYFT